MNLPFERIIRIVVDEAYRYRALIVAAFVTISLAVVSLGAVWPRSYTSSATIFVEKRSIIEPLMQGSAEMSSQVTHQAEIAKEVVFSRKVMYPTMEQAGWFKDNPTEVMKEQIVEEAKKRTSILEVGPSLIRIEVRHSEPERAFKTTKMFAESLIKESAGIQSEDTKEAFEFINKQTEEYHKKLILAEQQLKEFRSKNVDARPGTDAEVSARINTIRGQIDSTSLELKEAKIRKSSIERQLSGEAAITVSLTREGQFQSRIVELQSQLDNLRLSYKETYPDIVQIKHQIEDLKNAILEERDQRVAKKKEAQRSGKLYVDENFRVNPLYQRLRNSLAETTTTIETLETRLKETKKLLKSEMERAERVHGGEAEVAELTRDYVVNRDIYQDLLRRRENARVTMNIDREQRGLSMKIYEPAVLPIRPSGPRFIHFAMGGVLFGIIVPFGILYSWLTVDPRIRSPLILSEKLNMPVLASVPHMVTSAEVESGANRNSWLGIVVFINLVVIGVISAMRFSGVL